MPAARATYSLPAAPRTVAGILRDAEFAAAALARGGHRLRTDRRLLVAGSRARVGVWVGSGVRIPVGTAVEAVGPAGIVSGRHGLVRHEVRLTSEGATTRVDDEIRWTLPAGRGPMAALLSARAAELRARVTAADRAAVVVAAALVRDGRLLVARRTRPPTLDGRWELPGGRVEPGESEPDAVARECREELGAEVVATGRVGTDLPIDAGLLRVHRAELVPTSPEPAALEHGAVRWVGRSELDGLDWVDADRAVLAELRELLGGHRAAGGRS